MREIAKIGVLAVLLLIGCTNTDVSLTDFDIRDFKYESYISSSDDWPLTHNLDERGNEQIMADSTVILNIDSDGFQYKVYDIKHDYEEVADGYLKKGDNRIWMNYKLDFLEQDPQLEICIGKGPDFTRRTSATKCVINTYPHPNVEISITPNPIRFVIAEDAYEKETKEFLITNTGDVPMGFTFDYRDDSSKPVYYDWDTKDKSQLNDRIAPGESKTILFSVGQRSGKTGETYQDALFLRSVIGSYAKEVDVTTSIVS